MKIDLWIVVTAWADGNSYIQSRSTEVKALAEKRRTETLYPAATVGIHKITQEVKDERTT